MPAIPRNPPPKATHPIIGRNIQRPGPLPFNLHQPSRANSSRKTNARVMIPMRVMANGFESPKLMTHISIHS